jgi:hypothetical protein
MKTSKSTKTSTSTLSFTGVSPRGDLAEAFRNATKSLKNAGRGTVNLGEVSVTISVKPVKLGGTEDTNPSHPVKDLPDRR